MSARDCNLAPKEEACDEELLLLVTLSLWDHLRADPVARVITLLAPMPGVMPHTLGGHPFPQVWRVSTRKEFEIRKYARMPQFLGN